jgi:hypothetical protein
MVHLIDHRMQDGSRYFVALPQNASCYEVRDYVATIPGSQLTGFLCDDVTEAWIDFRYQRHRFTINDQLGEYWFFVEDPDCPDDILEDVVGRFTNFLHAPTELRLSR